MMDCFWVSKIERGKGRKISKVILLAFNSPKINKKNSNSALDSKMGQIKKKGDNKGTFLI